MKNYKIMIECADCMHDFEYNTPLPSNGNKVKGMAVCPKCAMALSVSVEVNVETFYKENKDE